MALEKIDEKRDDLGKDLLLLDSILDISGCSEDALSVAGSSILDSESLFGGGEGEEDTPQVLWHYEPGGEEETIQVHLDSPFGSGAEETSQVLWHCESPCRGGGEEEAPQVLPRVVAPLHSVQTSEDCKRKLPLSNSIGGSGKIIKLTQASRKFRYVPDSLPEVKLPPLARNKKHKRWSNREHHWTAPSLFLDSCQGQKWKPSQDLRKLITVNRLSRLGSEVKRNLSSPIISDSILPEVPYGYHNAIKCTASPNTQHARTPEESGSCSFTHALKTQSDGDVSQKSVFASCSVGSGASMMSIAGLDSLGLQVKGQSTNIFACRPGLLSHPSKAAFSLRHLGTVPVTTFSLDHLKS